MKRTFGSGSRWRVGSWPLALLAGLLVLAWGPCDGQGEEASIDRGDDRSLPEATAARTGLRAGDGFTPPPTPPPVAVRTPEAPSNWIYVGESFAEKVDAHPEGTTFLVKSGVHRGQSVRPSAGMAFEGEPGAVMSGAVVLADFRAEGNLWATHAPAPRGLGRPGQQNACRAPRAAKPGRDECWSSQDLFWNGTPLRRVASRGDIEPGRWFLDEAARLAYVGEDPAGHLVELSVEEVAFRVVRDHGVRIEGLVIEKYASLPGWGAVHFTDANEGVVTRNQIRHNSGAGVGVHGGWGTRIIDNDINDQGQIGISTWRATDVLIEENRISRNNTGRFDQTWEAGGVKVVRNVRPVMRRNEVIGNRGKGLWTDADNVESVFELNRVENNTSHGIFHEVSCSARIEGNTARNNGSYGILISGSPDTEVMTNTLSGNGWAGQQSRDRWFGQVVARTVRRGTPRNAACRWELENIRIHHNHFEVDASTGTLAAGILGSGRQVQGDGVRFYDNVYVLTNGDERLFRVGNRVMDRSAWQSTGQDTNSEFRPGESR